MVKCRWNLINEILTICFFQFVEFDGAAVILLYLKMVGCRREIKETLQGHENTLMQSVQCQYKWTETDRNSVCLYTQP
jgi:hypothetical protein